MFPEEALHCVEWGRNKFADVFTVKPKSLLSSIESIDTVEAKHIQSALEMMQIRPKNLAECVVLAR